jgi:hypothetical protein
VFSDILLGYAQEYSGLITNAGCAPRRPWALPARSAGARSEGRSTNVVRGVAKRALSPANEHLTAGRCQLCAGEGIACQCRSQQLQECPLVRLHTVPRWV